MKLFAKKSTPGRSQSSSQEAAVSSRGPLRAPDSAAQREFDTRQMLAAMNAKLLTATTIAVGAALAAVAAVAMLAPLKEVRPYVVKVDDKTGDVRVSERDDVRAFKPQWIHRAFFLRRWVEDLFTINRVLTTQVTDPRAQQFLRGQNAIAQFDAFRKSDATYERLAKDPALVRDVVVESLVPVAGTEGSAVATVRLTTRSGGQSLVERRTVTMFWIEVTPKTQEEAATNPLGLYITDFRVSE